MKEKREIYKKYRGPEEKECILRNKRVHDKEKQKTNKQFHNNQTKINHI